MADEPTPNPQESAQANGSVPERAPDVLGEQVRAQLVVEMLRDFQTQRFRLDLLQQANQAQDHDQVPDTTVTYGDRRKALVQGEERIVQAHPELLDAVRELIAGA